MIFSMKPFCSVLVRFRGRFENLTGNSYEIEAFNGGKLSPRIGVLTVFTILEMLVALSLGNF
jgi:hypothetical protein